LSKDNQQVHVTDPAFNP